MSANDVRTVERPIGTADIVDAREEQQLAPIEQPRRAQVVTPLEAQPKGVTLDTARVIVRMSEQINELVAALSIAQGAFEDLERTRTARIESQKAKYTYDYETLADVIAATRKGLSENGLAVMQFPLPVGSGQNAALQLRTLLAHKSGQWIYNDIACHIFSASPQDIASGITYLCRYARKAILGLAADWDDDAEAAQRGSQAPPQPSTRRSQQPAPEPAQKAAEPPAGLHSSRVDPPSPQGRVAKVIPKGSDTWIVELETGFRAGTRDAKMAADLTGLVGSTTVVRLTATTPSDPKYVGTIERAVEVK